VIGNLFAAVGLRPPLPVVRFVLSTLTVLAALCTFGGIIAALATKNDTLATKLLSVYPRYVLAMDAMQALQDMKFPIREGAATVNVGVVSIDEPSWNVLLDFVKSETAIRKSERTEALIPRPPAQPPQPTTPAEQPSIRRLKRPRGPFRTVRHQRPRQLRRCSCRYKRHQSTSSESKRSSL
jgi:hypothetical protein